MTPLDSVLEALREPAFVLDRDHKILNLSEGVEDLGYRKDVLVGRSFESTIAPPYRRTFSVALDTSFRLSRITTTNAEVLNAYGESVPVEMRINPLNDKGHVIFLVLMYPRSRISYDFLNALNIPVWVLDRKGGVIFSNDASREVLQRFKNSSIRDEQVINFQDIDYVAKVLEVVNGFQKVKVVALTRSHADYSATIKRFALAGVLSALAAHDVKNAIASVLLLLDLIEDEKLKEKLYKGVNRVYKIHKRILNLAKGKFEIGDVALDEIVEEISEDLHHKIVRKGIEIVKEFPKEFSIRTDRGVIYEILLNLVSNAIDASKPKGKVIISGGVSHKVTHSELEKYVSVKDFGSGIPPNNLEKVFNPFFTSKREGAGLGLFIVKSLSESVGARVLVRSEVGKGSEFTVFFPQHETERHSEVHGARSEGSDRSGISLSEGK